MLRRPTTLIWYGLLITVTVTLGLILPSAPGTLQTLNITSNSYRLSIASLILPYALILFLAFYAYNRLQAYAKQLHRTKEGHGFKNIANGTQVLAWGLALTTILTIILDAINTSHPGFTAARVIITNYAILLVPLIGFTYVGRGTRSLNDLAKVRISLLSTRIVVLLFLIIGVFFTHMIINNSHYHQDPYHLSLYWLILTFIIPYLYAWFIGILSANEIRLYIQAIKGIIYKKALTQLSFGITIVIIGSIVMQFINNQLATENNISLGSAFLAIYIIVVIEALGYGLIAYGARQLKRIEEV